MWLRERAKECGKSSWMLLVPISHALDICVYMCMCIFVYPHSTARITSRQLSALRWWDWYFGDWIVCRMRWNGVVEKSRYTWVMSHIWRSHDTHTNESRHRSEWVVSHTCDGAVKKWRVAWHVVMKSRYTWVMALIWRSDDTHTNESRHTYVKSWYTSVMALIWRSHDTHANESRHTHVCVVLHKRIAHMCVRWLIRMCVMTPSHECHDSCVPWLMCTLTSLRHVMTSPMCDVTHSYVCHSYDIRHTHSYVISHTWELVSYKGAGMQHTYIRIARALINIRIYLS